ncbi:hypothetical protein SAMN06295912_1792 [Sphingomonas laterariae]|uniref:Uncharacterized protein n=1 Tax=Edaphosphingomonas laterariae TaxID=861865 RepID=A0A239L3V6_9SPHN|nr:hypothetical protein [Sphingomonas laterariae]SNT25266.1 hypothetical protein SAMN06295912_1792 [Sphingomonas laterariae]
MTGGERHTQMDADRWAAAAGDAGAFEGGPPRRLTALALLPTPLCPNHHSRVLMVFVLAWLPLALLTQLAPAEAAAPASFLRDFGVHARFAFAAPLLVLGYAVCANRLGVIALSFLRSELLDDAGKQRFVDELAAVRRRANSLWAEAATVLIAYAMIGAIVLNHGGLLTQVSWQRGDMGAGLSFAGWWNALVSLPLLIILLIGWLWRILLWTRFLHVVAGLDLKLIAAHPDQAGGLGFLNQSVRAFGTLGMALGTISAGRFAQVYADAAATKFTNALLMGGTAVLVLLLFIGPLLAFGPPLVHCWRRGAAAYGGLASSLGHQFEKRWFTDARERGPDMLGEPDFSATVDLYGVVSNVYAMRFLPVDFRSVLLLLSMTLAPFIPAMFVSMPTDVVIAELKGLLF